MAHRGEVPAAQKKRTISERQGHDLIAIKGTLTTLDPQGFAKDLMPEIKQPVGGFALAQKDVSAMEKGCI